MMTMKGRMTDLPLDSSKPLAQPVLALWEPSPQPDYSRLPLCEAERDAPSPGGDDRPLRNPLTGLIGPALLADRLQHVLAGSRRNAGPVMFALLQLDRFGPTNRDHDDEISDQILQVVAARLTEALRATDTVAHLARNEFAIIVERPGDAELVARRLIEAIGAPMDIGGVSLWMSASLGAAIGSGNDPNDFFRYATTALQRSKERGGDSCTVLGRT